MEAAVDKVINSVNTSVLINRNLSDWRPILAKECQVYVFKDQYLAKRFDQINFRFTNSLEAKEILIDNLYALLRYKYFPVLNDEVEKRIQEIVKSFTINLKSTLIKVSFDLDSSANKVQLLSNSQVAFRNGVFDFKTNDWLFKYEVIRVDTISNDIYIYDNHYIIQWYFDFNFEPLPISILDYNLVDFIDVIKSIDSDNKNYCFELMYNMAHDMNDKFSLLKFKHICEVMGYTIMQSFSQYFVLLIGSGQNGKNSLIDGCFSHRIIPSPANISLDDIETDKFVTGALENRFHNIYLETNPKTYTESKMLKALTGSMYQTIEPKGITRYSGIINAKHIFAGNDQEKIKFSDTTNGFRRRINILEIFYTWDPLKRFLTKGDYYDTSFSDDLHEIKNDILNCIIYIYFGMYGILLATDNFTKNFTFTENDWRLSYTDMDFDLKDSIEMITPEKIAKYMKLSPRNYTDCQALFFDVEKERLQNSQTLKEIGYYNYDDLIKLFENDIAYMGYFSENDIYMSVRILQNIIGDTSNPTSFTYNLKKLYSLPTLPTLYNNKPYVKVTFVNKKLKILGV